MTIVLYYFLAIMQWLLFIYCPIAFIYAFSRLISFSNLKTKILEFWSPEEKGDFEDLIAVIRSPFLGIWKTSLKKGAVIWAIQIMFLGVELQYFYEWYHLGVNPMLKV